MLYHLRASCWDGNQITEGETFFSLKTDDDRDYFGTGRPRKRKELWFKNLCEERASKVGDINDVEEFLKAIANELKKWGFKNEGKAISVDVANKAFQQR